MAPIRAFLTRIVYVFDFLTGSSRKDGIEVDTLQVPIPSAVSLVPQATAYPIIVPPDDLEPVPFQCEYPDYPESDGWVACNDNAHRDCWLNNTKTGQQYNISIDYEVDGPRGIIRNYFINLTDDIISPDGYPKVPVQLFNGTLPGPRIQACWGDQIQITVLNSLRENGTAIHWHGLRQWKTGQMDGVNAITQCPIPPNSSFTYIFNMTQYGTSWYHSHYSLQVRHGTFATAEAQADLLLVRSWSPWTTYDLWSDFSKL